MPPLPLPHPGIEPRGCLHAGGEQKGPSSSTSQTNEVGEGIANLAPGIGLSSHGRAAQALGAKHQNTPIA
jgi:hypothetical protein